MVEKGKLLVRRSWFDFLPFYCRKSTFSTAEATFSTKQLRWPFCLTLFQKKFNPRKYLITVPDINVSSPKMQEHYSATIGKELGQYASEGLQDLYFLERKGRERASYSPAPKPDDYASRMMSIVRSDNPSPRYGSAEREIIGSSYHGSASSLYSASGTTYSSQNTAQKTFCCGRKNAGEHMRCGGCPER